MKHFSEASLSQRIDDLARNHLANVKVCEKIMNEMLAETLRRKRLKQVRLNEAMFTRVSEGLVVHGPIPLKDNVTKGDLLKRSHAVGVLLNSIALVDPVTGTGLAPGTALVELRPVLGGEFVFDFVGPDGRTRFSTLASFTDRERFESLPVNAPIAGSGGTSGFPAIDAVIIAPIDSLLPGTWVVCVSFGHWKKCWWFGVRSPGLQLV